jgi:hypothetical protein
MGAKYLPNIRDQRAAARYLKKQNPPPNYKKSSDAPAAAKQPASPAAANVEAATDAQTSPRKAAS